jgi:glycosyltransferase involved in cell wall biosynthesis
VVNGLVKNKLMTLGFPGNKIFVSSNGIDLKYFENIKRTEFSYEGVFLGRLNYSKGLADLIEIWKKVCQELPESKLAVIGGGNNEMKNFMMKNISNNKLERNIDLLGFLKDEKAYPILKSGKVFLFPSHEEGWGIAIAEAMACGLPVIGWDLPNLKPVFGNHILRVEENNFNLFAKKTIELLKNEKLRKKIGDEGREFIRKYSWENVAMKEYEIICQQ